MGRLPGELVELGLAGEADDVASALGGGEDQGVAFEANGADVLNPREGGDAGGAVLDEPPERLGVLGVDARRFGGLLMSGRIE